jgi:hypothetical protein
VLHPNSNKIHLYPFLNTILVVPEKVVVIRAIGQKDRNKVYIGAEEITL